MRRSRSEDNANQRSWARASKGALSAASSSRVARRERTALKASSASARRTIRASSSATSCCRVLVSWNKSSASSRRRASRASAWMVAALRAASAWRPSGPSCRRISPVRSLTLMRLASIVSILRSARSLRLRCFRTPAASSMKPRRSSAVARRMASSCPWPTMTCISWPIPESERSSWISNRRQDVPLMAYSEPPFRNIVRVIVTSV